MAMGMSLAPALGSRASRGGGIDFALKKAGRERLMAEGGIAGRVEGIAGKRTARTDAKPSGMAGAVPDAGEQLEHQVGAERVVSLLPAVAMVAAVRGGTPTS